MRSPILPISISFAVGVLCARFIYFSVTQLLFWIAVLLLFSCLLLRMDRLHYGLFVAWLGFFLAGTLCAKAEHSYLPKKHVETLAATGLIQIEKPSQLEGWARSPTIRRPGGEYVDIEVNQVTQAGSSIPTEGVARIYYFPSSKDRPSLYIAYGTRVSVEVRDLRSPRNYKTEGQYDYEAAQKRQGIYFTGAIRKSKELSVLPGREGNWFASLVSRLRVRLLANVDRLFPHERDTNGDGPVVKAMILGDDNWLPADTQTAFQESGTYHLLVVSGLHVSALALGVFWILGLTRLPEWVRMMTALFCTFAFVLLTNNQIPVARSALMVTLYLIARLFYRKRALLNSIALAGLILLIAHPGDIFNASFQLSFLSVTIIACMAVPMAQWTFASYRMALENIDDGDLERWLSPRQMQFRWDVRAISDFVGARFSIADSNSKRLRSILTITISAFFAIADVFAAAAFIQLGLTLSMVIYFHRVAWSGLVANPLVIPVATLLVPLGFAVLLASMIWWPMATIGARILAGLISLLHGIVNWSLRLPHFERRVAEPPLVLCGIFVLALLLFAVFASRKSRIVWLPMIVLVILSIVLTIAPYRPDSPRGQLEMTALDVGQGDSLFLTFPRGATMLLDGGGSISAGGEQASSFDVGERIVSPFLWARRIHAIDYVVLTHAHSDHLGGLFSVLRNFQVGELWISKGPSDRLLTELLQLAKDKGVRVLTLNSSDHRNIDGVDAEILSPPADWAPNKVSNNDSLVMRLTYGSRHLFLPGDAERPMENRLVEGFNSLASEVLKVGHHGSKTSTTLAFLQRVAPRFGIISVGAYRRFGHPNQEVLDALAQAGVKTYRTDRDGSVTVTTDGNKLAFSSFQESIETWPTFDLFSSPINTLPMNTFSLR